MLVKCRRGSDNYDDNDDYHDDDDVEITGLRREFEAVDQRRGGCGRETTGRNA